MIRIGTRGSDLALWQANHVAELLQEQAGVEVSIQIIKTAGDQIQDRSLASLPGKGFFTKEIEAALLAGDIDLAVHSHKDLPTEQPPGLGLAAVPVRGPVREVLLIRPEAYDQQASALPLQVGSVVGTGSARRQCQLLSMRQDLQIRDLRGNVPTRIGKITGTVPVETNYDAIVLAEAGLVRLGINTHPLRVHLLAPEVFVPAPAQGALALQTRSPDSLLPQDQLLQVALKRVHDTATARLVSAERRLLAALEGGCNLPLGAYAEELSGEIRLTAVLGIGGSRVRRCVVTDATVSGVAQRALASLQTG